MQIDDVTALVATLPGVRASGAQEGRIQWRYHGRLIARQLDDTHLVIRSAFEVRDGLLQQFPDTFSVPNRFARHMMIVADLAHGDDGAIEDAVLAAWDLQRAYD